MASSLLRSQHHVSRVQYHLKSIFESDRRSNFTAYEATAKFCADAFRQAGLADIELEPLPADGRTSFGDWIMPLAWDVSGATLHLLDGSRTELLADYDVLTDSLIQQSAPTPAGGLSSDLVPFENSDPRKWNGNIVFTRRHAQQVKAQLSAAGALGVISCYHPRPDEDPHSTYWYNTWSDRNGGWWATAQDSKLFGFSLSPEVGARIESRLARGEKLRVRCNVDSRFRSGTLPFISGRIDGTSEEEVLVCAHLYEHGAHDNASGAACVLETAAVLNAAIRDGKVARPRRGIRFLLMPECYGALAYAQLRPARVRRTIAGINLDGVGGSFPLRIVAEPNCCNAGLAAKFQTIAKAAWGANSTVIAPFELCDNLLSDPMIGIPMIWPHSACRRNSWHTSIDSLDVVNYEFIEEMAQVVCTLLRTIADSGLKRPARDAHARATPRRTKRRNPLERIPLRRTIGPISLDPVPVSMWPADIKDSPRWWCWQTRALWSADGSRNLDNIARAEKMDPQQVLDYFEFLARWNYVTFR